MLRIQYASGLLGKLSLLKPRGDVLALLGNCGSQEEIKKIAGRWDKVFIIPTANDQHYSFDEANIHYMIQREYIYNGITFLGAPIRGNNYIREEDMSFFYNTLNSAGDKVVCMSCSGPTVGLLLKGHLLNKKILWLHGEGCNTAVLGRNMFVGSNNYLSKGFCSEFISEV
jgi:hypothetical protein